MFRTSHHIFLLVIFALLQTDCSESQHCQKDSLCDEETTLLQNDLLSEAEAGYQEDLTDQGGLTLNDEAKAAVDDSVEILDQDVSGKVDDVDVDSGGEKSTSQSDASENDAEKCVNFDASTFGRENASIFVIEARGRVGNHLMAYTLIKAFQAKLKIQVCRLPGALNSEFLSIL